MEQVHIFVQIDDASIPELEQCAKTINSNLTELSQQCHKMLEELFGKIFQDSEFQALLNKEGLAQTKVFESSWEITLLLCSDIRMAQWNNQFRNLNETTDILSFPSQEPYGGDLLLSLDSWQENCREFGCDLVEELRRLLLHGLLHLAGLDHYPDEEPESPRSLMLLYQENLLKQYIESYIV